MKQPDFTIRVVENRQELIAVLHQRWLVLREPLGMPQGTESDRYEDCATHVVAIASNSPTDGISIIGSARLRQLSPDVGSIAYVAILPEFQQQGIGSALVQHLIELAQQQMLSQLRVMARLSAVRFYQRFGFVERGELINYLGNPHVFMHLSLSN